jgi:DNA-binding LacI/PurR family transcriptional regulator
VKRLPLRASLAGQTADILRESISSGAWLRWLPGELELTRRLHVSRATVRDALARLEREGIISGGQGRRREILVKPKPLRKRAASRHVVLLSPEPMHRQAPSTVFWMDELRDHLAATGHTLEVHGMAAAFRRRPDKALEELAARLEPAAWILHRSTPELQRWFSHRALPCLIAGTRHESIALPSVDIDHRAASRHAAGRLIARGRRNLAILRQESSLAGDAESASGFREGAAGAEVREILHDGTPAGICKAMERALKASPPDGVFVFHSEHALSAIGYLIGTGVRIPEALSFICRDDEPFLSHVVPCPARYTSNATVFARKISRLVVETLASTTAKPRQHWLMPEFVPGATL